MESINGIEFAESYYEEGKTQKHSLYHIKKISSSADCSYYPFIIKMKRNMLMSTENLRFTYLKSKDFEEKLLKSFEVKLFKVKEIKLSKVLDGSICIVGEYSKLSRFETYSSVSFISERT